MGQHRRLPLLLALLGLLAVSCATLGSFAERIFVKPEISLKSVSITEFDLDKLGLKVVLNAYNPNPYSVPLRELKYAIFLKGSPTNVPFLSGSAQSPTTLEALATNVIEMPMLIPFEKLLAHPITNGTLIYTVKGEAVLKNFENFPIPFSYTATIPIPKIPTFKIKSIRFTEFLPLQLKTSVALVISVENPNEFDLSLKDVNFKMEMAGKQVLTKTTEAPVRVGKKTVESIQLGFDLDLSPLKDIVTSFLKMRAVSVHFSGDFGIETSAGIKKSFGFDTKSDILIGK